MGLEVSRLARNSTDWHRLLEICALTDTLILDEDGIYDPAHFNDRLLLGLKGTMSEAELHVLRARLLGGNVEQGAPRGAADRAAGRLRLRCGGTGRARPGRAGAAGRAQLLRDVSPDRVGDRDGQDVSRAGSSLSPSRGTRPQTRARSSGGRFEHARALRVLHNPRYAGAFFYGRSRQRKHGDGRYKMLPREEWIALVRDAHPGYIRWEDFERNQGLLRENSAAHGGERRRGPPREGPAFLQGLVICGSCGNRMTVRYRQHGASSFPSVRLSARWDREGASRSASRSPGATIDEAVGKLVVETLTPMAIEITLAVQRELESRAEETDALRRKQVERAQYEVDLARRRYMRVDPDNRLVADSLEGEWNIKLQALSEAQTQYARQREEDRVRVGEETRARVLALANDLPALWRDPARRSESANGWCAF